MAQAPDADEARVLALGGTTFPQLLLEHAAARPDDAALREKIYGIWRTTTWRELADQVEAIAAGLAELGFSRGQHLAIIGENRPRLYAAMIAAQALGGVPTRSPPKWCSCSGTPKLPSPWWKTRSRPTSCWN
jgi:long-subunit acyl-CoA synthetase (AMP-forming)